MRRGLSFHVSLLVPVLVILSVAPVNGQPLKRTRGQNVQPAFEGWVRNDDGSYDLNFGYLNRNYEEEPEIPIGQDNRMEPGGPDRGQPTYFYARRQVFMFSVRVPADWGQQRLTWTLTLHGKTDRAVGSLNPEYELTPVVRSQNREGTGGDAGVDKEKPNSPPTISIAGPTQIKAVVGDTVSLAVQASDDGRPVSKPLGPRTVQAPRPEPDYSKPLLIAAPPPETPAMQAIVDVPRGGLGVTWVCFRGPGTQVTFVPDPGATHAGRFPKPPGRPMVQLVKDGKASTKVRFSEAGTYVIRAYADDGVLMVPADVTVVVEARPAP